MTWVQLPCVRVVKSPDYYLSILQYFKTIKFILIIIMIITIIIIIINWFSFLGVQFR